MKIQSVLQRNIRVPKSGDRCLHAPPCRWIEPLEMRWLLSDAGQLDPTFGDNGIALTGFAGVDPYGTAIVVTSEGKPIIAADQAFSGPDFTTGLNLERFNTDGSLDTSFGTQGKVSIAIDRFRIGDAVIQSDGKLLVAGTVADLNYPTSPTDVLRFIVLRFNTNGSLDTSFGTNGSVRTAFTSIDPTFSAEAKYIAVSSTGTIAVGGSTMRYVQDGDHVGIGLAEYNSSGQLLTSFSTDGLVTDIVTAPSSDELYGLGFQPDGKLLVSYQTYVPSANVSLPGTVTDVLMRYNLDGTPDSSFGANGEAQSVEGKDPQLILGTPTVGSDNKILLTAGNTLDVQRLNPDGSADIPFGGGDSIAEPAGNVHGVSWGMLLLSDGRIRVAGPTWVQYNADGTPDSTFSASTNQTSVLINTQGVFDPGGKLIVAGRSSTEYAVARVGRDDVALGSDGTLWVDGTAGNDTIMISPLNGSARLVRNGVTTDFTKPITLIQLALGSGNDIATITLGVPAVVSGGAGDDSITMTGASATTVLAGDGNDTVIGSAGPDSIEGGAGNDYIDAAGGNDTVGGTDAGRDTVLLGDGNDIYYVVKNVGTDPKYVDGGAGDDILTLASGGSDTILGGTGNDLITVSFGAKEIDAGDGQDTVVSYAPASTILGGAGDDVLLSFTGSASIAGGAGNDLIRANTKAGDHATIYGDDGMDTIYAGDGNDSIVGGANKDIIHAGNGNDTVRGYGGNDKIFGQGGDDLLYGCAGNDRIDGGDGNDTLWGNGGTNRLSGDAGDDVIYAWNRLPDTLNGGDGNDTAQADNPLTARDVVDQIETFV